VITLALKITQASVHQDGRRVANINWSGRAATVVAAAARPKALGRVLPAGYAQGVVPGDRYDAWTAKHPQVHTPSDTVIASDLSWNEAVAHIIKEASDG
jgi:hypothetical protein